MGVKLRTRPQEEKFTLVMAGRQNTISIPKTRIGASCLDEEMFGYEEKK